MDKQTRAALYKGLGLLLALAAGALPLPAPPTTYDVLGYLAALLLVVSVAVHLYALLYGLGMWLKGVIDTDTN